MKRRARKKSFIAATGFSLIEMIGVLAIMAILASIVVPNALKSIERAAVRAEAETLSRLGELTKLHLRDFGVPPNSAASNPPTTATSWDTQVAAYASLSAFDVLNNTRHMQRVYVAEPVATGLPQRAMILSTMRPGAPLPDLATLAGNFSTIWNWSFHPTARPRPPGFNAADWPAGVVEDFLVIERINYAPVYRGEAQRYIVSLSNKSGGPLVMGGPSVPPVVASYQITRANGTDEPYVNIAAQAAIPALSVYPQDRISLYRAPGAQPAQLDVTYVVSNTGKTFLFDGTGWIPQ